MSTVDPGESGTEMDPDRDIGALSKPLIVAPILAVAPVAVAPVAVAVEELEKEKVGAGEPNPEVGIGAVLVLVLLVKENGWTLALNANLGAALIPAVVVLVVVVPKARLGGAAAAAPNMILGAEVAVAVAVDEVACSLDPKAKALLGLDRLRPEVISSAVVLALAPVKLNDGRPVLVMGLAAAAAVEPKLAIGKAAAGVVAGVIVVVEVGYKGGLLAESDDDEGTAAVFSAAAVLKEKPNEDDDDDDDGIIAAVPADGVGLNDDVDDDDVNWKGSAEPSKGLAAAAVLKVDITVLAPAPKLNEGPMAGAETGAGAVADTAVRPKGWDGMIMLVFELLNLDVRSLALFVFKVREKGLVDSAGAGAAVDAVNLKPPDTTAAVAGLILDAVIDVDEGVIPAELLVLVLALVLKLNPALLMAPAAASTGTVTAKRLFLCTPPPKPEVDVSDDDEEVEGRG